jgi:hypothetical protein
MAVQPEQLQPLQPQQSSISAPRPGLGPESIRPGPLTWREVWG